LHQKLMTDVQGHQATRGRFRKIQNWVGKPGSTIATASYVPPPPGEVECDRSWPPHQYYRCGSKAVEHQPASVFL
jgi:hypothetical protein